MKIGTTRILIQMKKWFILICSGGIGWIQGETYLIKLKIDYWVGFTNKNKYIAYEEK